MTRRPELKVRFADGGDVPALLQLYRHLDPDDAATSLDDALKNRELLQLYPGSGIIVGCMDGAVIATCTLIVIPNLTRGGAPYALIENVVTDAAHRNKGYGKTVLKAATEAAWRSGCYKVMLLTGSQRQETLQFYQAAGFEQSKTGFQMRNLPPRRS